MLAGSLRQRRLCFEPEDPSQWRVRPVPKLSNEMRGCFLESNPSSQHACETIGPTPDTLSTEDADFVRLGRGGSDARLLRCLDDSAVCLESCLAFVRIGERGEWIVKSHVNPRTLDSLGAVSCLYELTNVVYSGSMELSFRCTMLTIDDIVSSLHSQSISGQASFQQQGLSFKGHIPCTLFLSDGF